jgi:hypothetical protein
MAPSVYGRHPICEHYNSIDVRRWHRDGRLASGQRFTASWTWGEEPSGSIGVRTEADAVILMFVTEAERTLNGNRSSNAYRSRGQTATWAAAARGLSVRAADAASPCFTEFRAYSVAGNAMGLRTRASGPRRIIAQYTGREKSD